MAQLLFHNNCIALALHFKGQSNSLFKISKSCNIIFVIEYEKIFYGCENLKPVL